MKKQGPYIAVVDLGTTGNRAVFFDLQGHEVVKAYQEFPTITEEPEQAEQDAQDWWKTTTKTLQDALKQGKINPREILAISVVTQRATLVPLDNKGHPLARAITWMDIRVSPSAIEHEALVKQRTSLRRALWFKDKQPEVFRQTKRFATPDAFIYQKLTGKLASDLSNHSFGILDRETLTLSDTLAEQLGLPLSLWPDIIPSGTVIGDVTTEAAKQTGLAAGTPVITGGGDQQCSAIGLGVLKQGVAKLTTGTGTVLITPVEKETRDPMGLLFCHPHVLPKQWVLEGILPGTGTILRWFRDNFGHVECAVAERLGHDPYDYIMEQAAQSPPGSNGLFLFPFFIWSLGILQGLGFQHTRADVARAILESVAYVPRFYLDVMFSANVIIEELRLDGGGSRSSLWRQINCDVTKKRCIKTRVDEGTALGAAILATVGLRQYASVEKAVDAMVHPTEIHSPNPETFAVYDQGFSKFQTLVMNNLQEILKHV